MKSMKGAVALGCLLAGTTLPALGVTINAGPETPLWDVLKTYTGDIKYNQAYVNDTGNQVQQASWTLPANTVGNYTVNSIIVEYAGYKDANVFGVYDAGAAAPTLNQIFPGSADPSSGSVTFVIPDTWTKIGFYLSSPEGTFYSDPAKNSNVDHMVAFNGVGGTKDLILGWEDKATGADCDFNDMVVNVQIVYGQSNPQIPDGGSTAALLGGAMLVLGGYRRLRR